MIKILSDVEKLRTDDLLINTGLINGGTARNTVMVDVAIKGEIRSYSKGLFYNAVKKVEKLKELSYEQLQVHAEIVVENPGYVHDKSDLEKVSSYLESIIGMKFIPSASYGCSDANIFNDNKIGLKVYNLSDGSYKHHTVDEYATVDNLNNLADIIFSIMTAKSNNLK
jgi:tripeptide aminopeptidase